MATAEEVDDAVARAQRGVPRAGPRRRSQRARRDPRRAPRRSCASAAHALAALAVRECAKPWAEADADVCEAIDFLEYYARGAVELQDARARRCSSRPASATSCTTSRAASCAVIAPWNFPLAIPLRHGRRRAGDRQPGRSSSPPSSRPAARYELVRALREAGVPPDALALLPGEGDVGARARRAPRRRHDRLHRQRRGRPGDHRGGRRRSRPASASSSASSPRWAARTASSSTPTPTSTTSSPRSSTPPSSTPGQKCSAAARVLAHEAIADPLLERLAGAVETLQVGQADTFGTDVPPVIEREAQERVDALRRAVAGATGAIAAPGDGVPDARLVRRARRSPPTCRRTRPCSPRRSSARCSPSSRSGTSTTRSSRIDALGYALTSGLFCRNPRTVEEVARRNPVGNLYVNRRITGAMVGRQPFGGNRLSAAPGRRPAGPDYLLHFVEPRVVTENTVRHGLVVE